MDSGFFAQCIIIVLCSYCVYLDDLVGIVYCLNQHNSSFAEGSCRLQPFDPDVPGRNWVKYGNKIVNKNDSSLCIQASEKVLTTKYHSLGMQHINVDVYSLKSS